MKKKVTVLILNARLIALSAMHFAPCLLGAMLFALSIPAAAQQPAESSPDRYSIPRERQPDYRRISARSSRAWLGGWKKYCP